MIAHCDVESGSSPLMVKVPLSIDDAMSRRSAMVVVAGSMVYSLGASLFCLEHFPVGDDDIELGP